MENSKQRTEELIDLYLSGKATTEECNQLERLYADAALKMEYVDDLEVEEINQFKKESFIKVMAEIRKDKAIWLPILQRTGIIKRISIVRRVVAIAAAIAVITLGTWLYYSVDISNHAGLVSAYANDVKPGSNKATLMLANGKTITLSNAKTGVVIADESLKYNDGSKVQVSSLYGKEQLTAATPRGGTYQVTLPDRTKVWLNADSKISFPSQFSGKERRITLSGEAYFEVAKSSMSLRGHRIKQSFIVITNSQQVEVLGTHFNISSYTGEGITKTTLLEGSVKISSVTSLRGGAHETSSGQAKQSSLDNTIILKPNQQATLAGNTLQVKDVNATESILWKNGKFSFSSEELSSIMRKVERWYNVEVVYENDKDKSTTFSGSVSRFDNVSSVLHMIEKTSDVRFRVEGRKVIVSR